MILRAMEKRLMEETLRRNRGDRKKTARELGIDVSICIAKSEP